MRLPLETCTEGKMVKNGKAVCVDVDVDGDGHLESVGDGCNGGGIFRPEGRVLCDSNEAGKVCVGWDCVNQVASNAAKSKISIGVLVNDA